MTPWGWATSATAGHLIRYAESEGLRDLHGDALAANALKLPLAALA